MATRNDITGDELRSKLNSKQFEDNFDRIFRKKETEAEPTDVVVEVTQVTFDTEKEFFEHGKQIAKELDNMAMPTATPTQPVEYAEDWQSAKRDQAIAQNGNVGYTEEEVNGKDS